MKNFLLLKTWCCRLGLIGLAGIFTYVVTRSSYNFAHWVPHNLLRTIGLDYATILWAEQNADIALHFFGGFGLTLLLIHARLPFISLPLWRPLAIIVLLCFAAEGAQYLIGRGTETSDLLLGICGSFMAYLASYKNFNGSQTST